MFPFPGKMFHGINDKKRAGAIHSFDTGIEMFFQGFKIVHK